MKGRSRLNGRNRSGFTLVELMIVLVVVAILLALAYPSYTQYVRKSKRGEAQQLLMNWSVNQEIYRSNHSSYSNGTEADGIPPPTHDNYTFTVGGVSASGYTLTADANGDQEKDVEDGQGCGLMTLTSNGAKNPIRCWGGRS